MVYWYKTVVLRWRRMGCVTQPHFVHARFFFRQSDCRKPLSTMHGRLLITWIFIKKILWLLWETETLAPQADKPKKARLIILQALYHKPQSFRQPGFKKKTQNRWRNTVLANSRKPKDKHNRKSSRRSNILKNHSAAAEPRKGRKTVANTPLAEYKSAVHTFSLKEIYNAKRRSQNNSSQSSKTKALPTVRPSTLRHLQNLQNSTTALVLAKYEKHTLPNYSLLLTMPNRPACASMNSRHTNKPYHMLNAKQPAATDPFVTNGKKWYVITDTRWLVQRIWLAHMHMNSRRTTIQRSFQTLLPKQ